MKLNLSGPSISPILIPLVAFFFAGLSMGYLFLTIEAKNVS